MSFGRYAQNIPPFSNSKHIGDIEDHKILFFQQNGFDYYGLTVGDEVVSFVATKPRKIKELDVQELWSLVTSDKYKGQNLAKKLLFFIKSFLSKSIIFGDVM